MYRRCSTFISPVYKNVRASYGRVLCDCRAYSSVTGSEVNVEQIETPLPSHAKVVICGGGIIGNSIAYHLSQKGLHDILLLDKGRIGEGATCYSAGIVGQLKGTSSETRMIQYSIELYKSLSEQHGLDWIKSGALFLARTADRQHRFERYHENALCSGTKTEMLSAEEVSAKYPYINNGDLHGGILIPEDIIVNTKEITQLMRKISQQHGARFVENCALKKVETCRKRNMVTSVVTSHGEVKCDYFINAAGQWSRMIGKLSRPRVRVPIHSVEHYYMLATPKSIIDPAMPVIRDYDNHCYFRPWGNSVMAGAFELTAKPIFHDGVPDTFNCARDRLTEDWDQLQFTLDKVMDAIPELKTATIEDVVTGTEAFTPDRHWIIGQSPELKNYYLAAGFCGAGTAAAGGIGQRLARVIIDKEPIGWHDAVDVKRFVDLHNNIKYLRARVKESVGFEYGKQSAIPDKEFFTARALRVSPLYTRSFKAQGRFSENLGYERVKYFKSNAPEEESLNQRVTRYGKPKWFDIVKTEYWACRETVCLVDMSSFAKLEIRSDSSDELVDYLQYVCANDVNRPVGTVIHSGMLNNRGGYENDCSLFRIDENRYMAISPASQQTRNLWWLTEHLPPNSNIQISDITSMYTVLNVIGPKAREMLAELTDVSLKVADFPHMTGKPLYVANAGGVIAMRLTHAGEDGFMLYIPSEYALHVYDTLMNVGKDYGIRNAGYFALRSLRTEKFFAYWGTDLGASITPLECSRDHRVKLSSGIDFIGRDALLQQKQEGIKKKFVLFTLTDHDETCDNFPWRGEPIYRNGKHIGSVTSSAYGYTLSRMVCLGFISNPNGLVNLSYITDKNAQYEVAIGSKRFNAKAYAYPPKIEAANLGFYLPARKTDTSP